MPGINDSFMLSLKNSYNSYTRSLVDNDNITTKNLGNKLILDIDNVKKMYKLDTNRTYKPEETKEAIQTNFNNGLYNGVSFGSSPKEVFTNYKTERKLLVEQKNQNIKLITQNTKDKAKQLNDQIIVTINEHKKEQINNINTINNTRRSLNGSPFTQLSKYKTHKNTNIQNDLKELYTEYNKQQELGSSSCCCCDLCCCGQTCCSCICYDKCCDGNGTDLDECCGGTAYDPSGAEECCGGHTFDPEIENCCDGTWFCSYYNNTCCFYNNITLDNVIVDGSCPDGFKWAAYIHWHNIDTSVFLISYTEIVAVDGACSYAANCQILGNGVPSDCSDVGGEVNGIYYSPVNTQTSSNTSLALP